jgi:acyl-coenzyme A thioesterase PaaI-like protein
MGCKYAHMLTRGLMTESFFVREGDHFHPNGICTSPWQPTALSGAALAGLAAHTLDRVPAPTAMVTARLTIDILGTAPVGPVTTTTRVVREGPRLQLIDVELQARGRSWLRATALRVRTAESPEQSVPPTRTFPTALETKPLRWGEYIPIDRDTCAPRTGASWVRVTSMVVDGEPLSPLERIAITSDTGSGTAPLVSRKDWTYANIDIATHMTREPRGEWLLVDARSESAGNGIGLIHSMLGDRDGMIGMAHQTLFLQPRSS